MAGRGQPRTGGRRKGTPNRATAEVRDAARKYTTRALKRLVGLMECGDPRTEVAACREILDRGHGRPTQPAPAGGDGPPLAAVVNVIIEADDASA